jgi:hypothetical protein
VSAAALLTGTVGAGKTALAVEAGEVLSERAVPTAVVDLDWLGWFHGPVEPGELAVRNLATVWPNFRAAGAERLLLTRAVRSAEEVEAVRDALGGIPVALVLVTAPPAVVEARLRRRDTGTELAEHLAAARSWAAELDELPADVRIENGERPIREVALELVGALGWDDPARG